MIFNIIIQYLVKLLIISNKILITIFRMELRLDAHALISVELDYLIFLIIIVY